MDPLATTSTADPPKPPPPRLRRFPFFRIRLRTLLLALTALCVLVLPEISTQLRQHRACEVVRNRQDCAAFYYVPVHSPSADSQGLKSLTSSSRYWIGKWIANRTGSNFFRPVVYMHLDNPTAETLSQISGFPYLRVLEFGSYRGLTDRPVPELQVLRKCFRLEFLLIGCWQHRYAESPAGLRVRGVTLVPCDITETDLETIGRLRRLRVLAIGGWRIDDTTIRHLASLKNLEYLYLSHSEVSGEGIAWLKEALPGVTITQMIDPTRDYSVEVRSRF